MSIKFSWDENKAESNIIKHGIDFDEAKTVFYDDNALLSDEQNHSEYKEG